MSTEFTASSTGEMAFVRYCRTAPCGARTSFEFGTVTNWEAVVAAARAGETFHPETGDWGSMDTDPVTAEDFEAMAASGRATFGVFPVTVAVGSGEMFRFAVEA